MTDEDTGCGYTCAIDDTAEKRRALDERQKLAQTDNTVWLRSFDKDGRYYDPATGFWESLNSEIRNDDGTWETITEADADIVACRL